MKLKSQLIISIAILGAIFLIIFSSYIITNQRVTRLNNQEQVAINIQTGASDLNYLTNDFFLFQQSEQVTLFQSKISSLTDDLSKLNPTSPTEATLINNTKNDLQRLDSVFGDSVSFLENAPRNVSVRVLPAFQTAWSRLAVQSQTLTYDSVQLSQTIRNQSDQLKQTNSLLVFSMVGAFAVYFAMIYFLVFRRTFRSITKLQDGTKIIGSGNLDYSITAKSNDEIGDLARAFNQMTTNLKTVTASKTDLEQAQASLRESEQRWATTLASIGDAVIATDLSGKIMFMNVVAENLTGWTLDEASQKQVKEVFSIVNEQTRLEVENPITRVLKEGVVVGLANHTILLRRDDTEVPIDDSGAPIKDNDGKITGVVLIFRNITERKKAEEKLEEYNKNLEEIVEERTMQLKDSERLAAIGATAGMVGHDIRNPLQAIISDVYLMKTDLASTQESVEKKNALESLYGIEENIEYINKIVADLQDFARPLKPNIEETDLKLILDVLLSSSVLPEDVKVSVKVEPAATKFVADSSYVNRIMTNLVINAVQSMPKGGKLTIQAYKEAKDVVITVTDTGVGIPESVKAKLFTPMFTTKAKGQGLGLAVIKRLTEALGGTVAFES